MNQLRRAYASGWLLVALLCFVAIEATAVVVLIALGARP